MRVFPKNDGIGEINILQNQFTAYVVIAVHRRRARYLASKAKQEKYEIPLDLKEPHRELRDERDMTSGLPLLSQLENEQLALALKKLKARELRILSMKVLEGYSLQEIADRIHSSRPAISSVYYRTLCKLKLELGEK